MENIEAARKLAIRIFDFKRNLSELDKGVQSLSVDKDIVLGDKDKGVQSLLWKDWTKVSRVSP